MAVVGFLFPVVALLAVAVGSALLRVGRRLLELKRASDMWCLLPGFQKIGLAASALSGRSNIGLSERGEVSGPHCVGAVLGLAPEDTTLEAWFSRQLFQQQHDGKITLPAGKHVQNMSGYCYLSTLNNPEILEYAIEQARAVGANSTGTPAFYRFELAQRLEDEIAQFLGMAGAVVFQSGYQACVAGLKHFYRRGDLILYDSLIHASDYEGIQLSRATMVKFKHNDFKDCERQLLKHRRKMAPEGNICIVMESVYSMDGDIGDLPSAAALVRKYGGPERVHIVVDESHGFGLLGPTGRGLEEYWGMPGTVYFVVSSLTKGISGFGGFFAARDKRLLACMTCNTQLVFSGMMSPFQAAFTRKALETARTQPDRCVRARENASYLRNELTKRGYDCGLSCDASAIVPVIMDTATPWEMTELQLRIQERGFFTFPLYSSAIAVFKPRFRLCGNAHMTKQMIDEFVAAFDDAVTQQVGHRNGVDRVLCLSSSLFGSVRVDAGPGRSAVLSTIGLGNESMLLSEVDAQINPHAADGWSFSTPSAFVPMRRVPVVRGDVYEKVACSLLPKFLAAKGLAADGATAYFPHSPSTVNLQQALHKAGFHVSTGDLVTMPFAAMLVPGAVSQYLCNWAGFNPMAKTGWETDVHPAHASRATAASVIAGDLGHICQVPDSALEGKTIVTDTMKPAVLKRLRNAGVRTVVTLSPSNEQGLCLGSACSEAMWRKFLGDKFSAESLRTSLEEHSPFSFMSVAEFEKCKRL